MSAEAAKAHLWFPTAVSPTVLTSEVHRQVNKMSNRKPQQQQYEMGELEFHQKAAHMH